MCSPDVRSYTDLHLYLTTPDSLLLDHEPNSKLPELDWLTETLSNCTSEQRQTVIELSKVYLRSL